MESSLGQEQYPTMTLFLGVLGTSGIGISRRRDAIADTFANEEKRNV